MGAIREFRAKLIGDTVLTISILAESHTIAIYRAATVATMIGAKDFYITPPSRWRA